jgi:hypothetical protein
VSEHTAFVGGQQTHRRLDVEAVNARLCGEVDYFLSDKHWSNCMIVLSPIKPPQMLPYPSPVDMLL